MQINPFNQKPTDRTIDPTEERQIITAGYNEFHELERLGMALTADTVRTITTDTFERKHHDC